MGTRRVLFHEDVIGNGFGGAGDDCEGCGKIFKADANGFHGADNGLDGDWQRARGYRQWPQLFPLHESTKIKQLAVARSLGSRRAYMLCTSKGAFKSLLCRIKGGVIAVCTIPGAQVTAFKARCSLIFKYDKAEALFLH